MRSSSPVERIIHQLLRRQAGIRKASARVNRLDNVGKHREYEATNTRGIECLVESVVFTRDGGLPNLTGWILILSVPAAVLGLGMTIAWVLGGVRDPN